MSKGRGDSVSKNACTALPVPIVVDDQHAAPVLIADKGAATHAASNHASQYLAAEGQCGPERRRAESPRPFPSRAATVLSGTPSKRGSPLPRAMRRNRVVTDISHRLRETDDALRAGHRLSHRQL